MGGDAHHAPADGDGGVLVAQLAGEHIRNHVPLDAFALVHRRPQAGVEAAFAGEQRDAHDVAVVDERADGEVRGVQQAREVVRLGPVVGVDEQAERLPEQVVVREQCLWRERFVRRVVD